jgi:ferredoxin
MPKDERADRSAPALEDSLVHVVACDDVGGIEAPELPHLIETAVGRPVALEIVPALCRRPRLLTRFLVDARPDHLVLAVCSESEGDDEYRMRASRSGLDPFAVELAALDLEPATASDERRALHLALQIAAAVAKTLALDTDGRRRTGVSAERLGRRTLLSGIGLTARPIAWPLPEACAGSHRCGLCVAACPAGAIRPTPGPPEVDPARCTGCSVCVTACPAAAMSLPGASIGQFEAQLRILLGAPDVDVVLACRGARLPEGAEAASAESDRTRLLMRVPCLAMVTPGWILQIVASGATASLLPCSADCRALWADPGEGRLAFCRLVLERSGLGDPVRTVRLLTGSRQRILVDLAAPGPGARAARPGPLVLSEPAATTTALPRLRRSARRGPVTHPASTLGLLDVREDRCTLCGACATVCPTSALTFHEGEDRARLSFDAARCVPCGRCVSACPERAMTVRRGTDLRLLAGGELEVAGGELSRCRGCGRRTAPTAAAERVRDLLDSTDQIGGLCALCALGATTLAGSPSQRDRVRR